MVPNLFDSVAGRKILCIFAVGNKTRQNMETITIQYDAQNAGLKGLIAALLKLDGVKQVESDSVEYDPEIVDKVQRGREDFLKGNCVSIKAEEVWN